MKPTKEQLADPKWWQDNSNGLDFIYECESTGEIAFANREGKDNNGLRLRLELDIWKLLAKRPEPEKWKPKEGEWCEARTSGKWRKVKTLNVDLGNDLMGFYVPVTENGLSRLIWSDNYRPIKTQREEFIEKALSLDCEPVQGMLSRKDFFGELYDAGCRFDLTEKDDN